jgi:PQQ-dependent dehydrogenase (s-GDH family)
VKLPRRIFSALAIGTALVISARAQGPLARYGVKTDPPERFSQRVVVSGLRDPWEVLLAPDGSLWATERGAKRIIRIDPATGATRTLVDIPDAYQTDSQDGVLGLALHPGLMKGRGTDFVYVSFVSNVATPPAHIRRLSIRRYTLDTVRGVLGSPLDLISQLPATSDHTGGRLALGPDLKLYMTVGDNAANHLGHVCDPNHAQDLPSAANVTQHDWTMYQGKILRLNLDGSIPIDNPVLAGIRSHVFSLGHRNPQGLVFGPDGKLYSSEHGPDTDDEVNLIRSGKNYGWPFVAGYQDDRAYIYANWSASSPAPCNTIGFDSRSAPASVPQQKETAWKNPDLVPPLRTFFTVDDTFDFKTLGNATIAPSGVDVYKSSAIPGWANSLLVTSLKLGSVLRLKLSPDGTSIVGDSVEYFKSGGRYRDVAVSPDGLTVYVAVDTSQSKEFPGSIVAFTWQKN